MLRCSPCCWISKVWAYLTVVELEVNLEKTEIAAYNYHRGAEVSTTRLDTSTLVVSHWFC